MEKLNNKQKIDLILNDLKQYVDGNSSNDSLIYAYNNGYRLHAASLWLGTGAMSENIESKIQGVKICYKKEMKEIRELCKNAFIYICKHCNAHAFLEESVGDTIQCQSCLKEADYIGPKIDVVFKKFKGEILAIFKNEIENKKGDLLSYQSIGQHGPCSKGLLKLKNAKRLEYKKLLNELERVGYKNLNVLNKD
jgi:hypothetical protein